MRNGKINTISFAVKLTIALAVLSVIFLGLSIISAEYSVSRTAKAIEAIGTVDFSDQSKEKIDLARSYYSALDKNLDLDKKIDNSDKLTAAEFEYIRLAIKRAYLADKNGEPEEVVSEYITQARSIFNEYCASGECVNISNYADLTALEEKYSPSEKSQNNSSNSENSEPQEEIELC